MNFNTVDLQKELQKVKSKVNVLDEVQQILNEDLHKEEVIANKLQGSKVAHGNIEKSKLNQDHIYSLDQIKQICIKYRLRFLDSKSIYRRNTPRSNFKNKSAREGVGTAN